MKITSLGHAGLLIETNGKRIVCDPWFSQEGAFLCSWHQWPRNDRLGSEIMNQVMSADYLYVSHLHRDHFDEEFLRAYFAANPNVVVFVPKFNEPNILYKELAKLGATNLQLMPDREALQLDGFTAEVLMDWNGTYANKGDSGICITDQDGRIFNQNDSKHDDFPSDIDIHFTQFSGAIWYPMAYKEGMKDDDKYHSIVASEVERRQIAFINTITKSAAKHVFPHAGPPVFLRDYQRWMNEPGESVFYDQPELLSYIRAKGVSNAHVSHPGMIVELNNHEVTTVYPGMTEAETEDFYAVDNKLATIAEYAESRRSTIEKFDSSLPEPSSDLGEKFIAWLNPILEAKASILDNVASNILVQSDDNEVRLIIDHANHEIRVLTDTDEYDHSFTIPRRIMELMELQKQRVWTSEVFLGVVHTSWRKDAYNKYVYELFAQMGLPPAPKQ
jgi:UDP-MurNAc hydroxylase